MKHSFHSVTLHNNILWVIDMTGIYWAVLLLPCYRKASQFLYSWCCILEFILIASDRRKLSKEAAQYNLIYFNSVTQDKNNRKHRCVSCDNWNCVLIWIDWMSGVHSWRKNWLLCYCRQWGNFRQLLCFWWLCTLWYWTDFNTEGKKLLFLILRKSECWIISLK